MKTDLHLVFPGTCDAAFTFYEGVFGAKRLMRMTFGEAPPNSHTAERDKDRIMHTSMMLGSMMLMGCDAPSGREEAIGGMQISLTPESADEVQRLFTALSKEGDVMMAPTPTFWSPLFAMFKDKYGVGWMVQLPGEAPPQA